ncbi:hypothetical protein [Streptomyces sp. SJL17-1]|uniref:hypothetical protein n=1 Tax=Streptomyces sp. SJL17-1 TaxID=2967223 RepID=UPI00398FD4F6
MVKSLNTMTDTVMVEPGRVPGHHNVILDLGDLTSARAVEQLVQLWLRLYGMFGTGDFNFSVVTAPTPAQAG